jgi:hypothetical protein
VLAKSAKHWKLECLSLEVIRRRLKKLPKERYLVANTRRICASLSKRHLRHCPPMAATGERVLLPTRNADNVIEILTVSNTMLVRRSRSSRFLCPRRLNLFENLSFKDRTITPVSVCKRRSTLTSSRPLQACMANFRDRRSGIRGLFRYARPTS